MVANNTGVLYSIALLLTPTREATVRATVGHQAYAAFLHTIRQSDRALADVLHNAPLPLKPFTVSPLLGVPKARNGWVAIVPAREYWLRFTVLYPPIFQQFMARFLRPVLSGAEGGDARPTLRLGAARFAITEILVTPGASPWSGYTSFAQLYHDSRPEGEIALEFTSPTAFSFGSKSWGRKCVVFPDPTLVFRSLLKSWNAFAPPGLYMDQELLDYVAENVIVKRHQIQTQMLRYSKHPQIGFVGQVTYGLMGREHEMEKRSLNGLADFAFYAGVGYKTTMGMGQSSRIVRSP